MKHDELAALLGVTPRQVRYLIAERIVGPATATGRGADGYGPSHVADGRRYAAAVAAAPGGRLSAAEARAALGFPHGDPDGAARTARFGPVTAWAADPAALAVEDPAELAGRFEAWLRALAREGEGR